jgi:hypothetical protein
MASNLPTEKSRLSCLWPPRDRISFSNPFRERPEMQFQRLIISNLRNPTSRFLRLIHPR